MLKAFNILKKRRQDFIRIREARRRYMDKMLRSVFYSFRSRIYQKKLIAFVALHYKRKLVGKTVENWARITKESGERAAIKIRQFSVIKAYQILHAWKKVIYRQRELKSLLGIGLQRNQQRLLFEWFTRFKEQSRVDRLAKIRQKSVLAYVMQKQQLRAFAALLLATQQSRKNKQNQIVADAFYKETRKKGVFNELLVLATGKKCHRQCVLYISKRRLLPKVLRSFTINVKSNKIKS